MSAMNMFGSCHVYITAVCSVHTTNYFLRCSRLYAIVRYSLDSSTGSGIESPPVHPYPGDIHG